MGNKANETVHWECVEDTYLAPPQALGVHIGPPRSRHQDRRDLLGKSHFPVGAMRREPERSDQGQV